jgi:hypothetical protein
MLYAIIKAAISGILVMAISEIAKRSPAFGALVASLPLVSILGVIWLWRDTGDRMRVSAHVEATFWYVLPSLPMFLLFPYLFRHGMSFWPALAIGIVTTIALYGLTIWVAARFGVRL